MLLIALAINIDILLYFLRAKDSNENSDNSATNRAYKYSPEECANADNC